MGALAYSSAGAGVMPPGSVENAELADMAALTIKGNATNATAAPQDISASANDRLLTRIADALGFTQITNGMLPTNTVGLDKLANAAAQYDLIGRKTASAGAWEDCTRTDLLIAGTDLSNNFTVPQTITNSSATVPLTIIQSTNTGGLFLIGDGVANGLTVERHSADSQGAQSVARKSRGTYASPAVPITNDAIGQTNFNVYTGAGFTNAAQIQALCIETATVSTSAVGSKLKFRTCAVGAASIVDSLQVDNTTGYQAFGNNIWFDTNRIFRPRSYTISTLPTITTTGIIHCSDLGPTASSAGSGLLMSNGTNWVRVSQAGVESIASDAAYDATWQYLTNAPTIRGAATMTADRTYTLGTTNVVVGARVRVARLNSSAFNWSVVGATTVVLARTGDWVEFEYSLAGWILTAHYLSKPSGVATISTDANHTATYSVYGGADHVRGNATLTATRTYTLGTTGAKSGDRVTITRLGTGAFNWDIVGSTTVSLTATKQWVTFEYDGSAWNMAAGGTIP